MLQPAKEGPNDAQVKAIKARFNVDLTKKSTSTPISPKKAADKDGATQTAGDSEAEQAKISDTEAAKSEEEREEGDLVARLGEQEARADRQEAEEYVVAPDGRVIGVIGDDTGEAGGEPLRAQDDPDQPPVEAGASASPDEFPSGAEERRPAVEAFPAGRDYAVEPGPAAAYRADRAFANAEFAAGRWDEEDRPAAADEPEPEIDGHPGGSVAVAAAAASAAAAAGVTSGSRIVTHPVPADWPGLAEAFGPSPPLPYPSVPLPPHTATAIARPSPATITPSRPRPPIEAVIHLPLARQRARLKPGRREPAATWRRWACWRRTAPGSTPPPSRRPCPASTACSDGRSQAETRKGGGFACSDPRAAAVAPARLCGAAAGREGSAVCAPRLGLCQCRGRNLSPLGL